MGIRIHKTIGYFLSEKKISKILVDNYEEIIYSLRKDDIYEKVNSYLYNLKVEISEKEYLDYELSIIGKLSKEDIKKSIEIISNGDEFKGIIFRMQGSEENYSTNIDFYSCTKRERMLCEFKQIKIKYPIYPCYGYLYMGSKDKNVQDFALKNNIKVGSTINEKIPLMYRTLMKDKYKHVDFEEQVKKLGLRPNFEQYLYYIAKSLGLLKENVNITDFAKQIEGSVITYWV